LDLALHCIPLFNFFSSLGGSNQRTYILYFKVLGKQSFSICFPSARCFIRILFHFLCKFCRTNVNIFFVWYLHAIYLHYKNIDTSRITCYYTIESLLKLLFGFKMYLNFYKYIYKCCSNAKTMSSCFLFYVTWARISYLKICIKHVYACNLKYKFCQTMYQKHINF
jgi:hypothetical protein